MPQSCQYLRDIWPWLLLPGFNLVSPELVRQLYYRVLLGPFQLKYSILLCSEVLACCSLHGQYFPVYKHAEYNCRFLLQVRGVLRWLSEGRGTQCLIQSHPAKTLPLNSVTTGAGPVQSQSNVTSLSPICIFYAVEIVDYFLRNRECFYFK